MKNIFAIALACATTVSSAAAAQTTTSTCSYVGAYIQCNTNTPTQFNFGGVQPRQVDMNQAVSNGIKLGQQARVAAALRDLNIHDPESVNRTISILIQNGAMDQAMALQNIVNQRR